MDRRIHVVGMAVECLLLARLGSQGHASGTSAYPPTGDILWPMSVFVLISSAYMRRLHVKSSRGREVWLASFEQLF